MPKIEKKPVALVTGGGGAGLGRAMCHELANRGFHVVVADFNKEAGKKVAREVSGTFVHADLSDPKHVSRAFGRAREKGDVRVIVNNAVMVVRKTLKNMSLAEKREMKNVNVLAPDHLMEFALTHMSPGGVVVNVSAAGALKDANYEVPVKVPETEFYFETKRLLNARTRQRHIQFAVRKLHLASICIKPMDTQHHRESIELHTDWSENKKKEYFSGLPLPGDVARKLAFYVDFPKSFRKPVFVIDEI